MNNSVESNPYEFWNATTSARYYRLSRLPTYLSIYLERKRGSIIHRTCSATSVRKFLRCVWIVRRHSSDLIPRVALFPIFFPSKIHHKSMNPVLFYKSKHVAISLNRSILLKETGGSSLRLTIIRGHSRFIPRFEKSIKMYTRWKQLFLLFDRWLNRIFGRKDRRK